MDQGLKGGADWWATRPSRRIPARRAARSSIRVTVDASGRVTGASYEPKGSTTDAAELIEAAKAAARKARFTESRATVQGGTITYIFRNGIGN
ncbi:MAG: TonB family protein [Alistipes communis]